MKVIAEGKAKDFEPIILTITIESKQELADLYGYANRGRAVVAGAVNSAMPAGYEYNGSFTYKIYKVLSNYLGRL